MNSALKVVLIITKVHIGDWGGWVGDKLRTLRDNSELPVSNQLVVV